MSAASHTVDWTTVRSWFPVTQHKTYLNTGTYGPVPQAALDNVTQVTLQEVEQGRCDPGYFERIGQTRTSIAERLAGMLGARPQDMVLTNATTHGAQVVASGLRLCVGDEIVSTDTEHHSFTTVLRATQATVKLASVRDTDSDTEVIERIRAKLSDRTKLIALSHVSWMDGRVLPVAEVSKLGLPVLVDGAQSVGAIPTDVSQLNCAFIVFPCQKWLLGPDATGGIYIAPEWHSTLDVALPSYYGHEPFVGNVMDTPLADAEKFSPGSIALSALVPLDISLALASELGKTRFERALQLSRRAHAMLSEHFQVVTTSPQSTLLSFDPGADANEVAAALHQRGIIVRTVAPENWIRVSLGFWNNESDCDVLLRALKEIV